MSIYIKRKILLAALAIFFSFSVTALYPGVSEFTYLPKETWDKVAQWEMDSDGRSRIELSSVPAKVGDGLELNYILRGRPHGWVLIRKAIGKRLPESIPIVFLIKVIGTGDLELKFVDGKGTNFGRKISLDGKYEDWTQIVLYRNNLEYWWSEEAKSDGVADFELAISGRGRGIVWLDEIGFGHHKLAASFPLAGPVLDSDRKLSGIGFRQRRANELIPEDPLVLEWLKQVQDASSPDKRLVPSEEDNQAQTFNNSLAAMAFILKGEKERAERILDFYSEATVRENDSPALQNFYYKGAPRGFFQYVNLNAKNGVPAYHQPGGSDRWMGDMAWLLIAYKHYEKMYNSDRYSEIIQLLRDLLVSWYKDAGEGGGYVQSGWRKGDSKLHEELGHPEGNIDAYAAFNLVGEKEKARKIKIWLDGQLKGELLPLDLYTWRVLAYGKKVAHLLDIPDYDLRYRKTLTINGKEAVGVYPFVNIDVNNIWLDGTGHMACAYMAVGNKKRGFFYANQLDAFLIDRTINGVKTRALPYTGNKTGEYGWVKLNKGFASSVAWYIFAKNGFNPLKLEKTSFD